jgi:hypothetical protein
MFMSLPFSALAVKKVGLVVSAGALNSCSTSMSTSRPALTDANVSLDWGLNERSEVWASSAQQR